MREDGDQGFALKQTEETEKEMSKYMFGRSGNLVRKSRLKGIVEIVGLIRSREVSGKLCD